MDQNLSAELFSTDDDLKPILGKHWIHQCLDDELYEVYVKNRNTIDFRTLTGVVAGRWFKGQHANIVRLSSKANLFNISWYEATGACASLIINLDERVIKLNVFFPRWIMNDPDKTIGFENEHVDEILRQRDAGPTYPLGSLHEFAKVKFIEDCGENNETVIACHPKDLPDGYLDRSN
ncbi:hypothetical protein I4U23_000066 [Adineta vaga]|nr:hypothetical protein I4U23_000066 [Adineta vaga]